MSMQIEYCPIRENEKTASPLGDAVFVEATRLILLFVKHIIMEE